METGKPNLIHSLEYSSRVRDVAQIQKFNLIPFLTETATTFISDAFVGPSQANTSSALKHYLYFLLVLVPSW